MRHVIEAQNWKRIEALRLEIQGAWTAAAVQGWKSGFPEPRELYELWGIAEPRRAPAPAERVAAFMDALMASQNKKARGDR